MLEALDLFQKKTGLRVIYTFVGGGIWEKELLEKAAKTSLEFTLLPRQEKPALAKVIQQSDFLIHASSYETFGLIALEALAAGTPVITSNLPSLEEFVIEGRGFCSENIATHFEAILEKLVDYPFQAQSISEEISKQYSAAAVGNSLLAIAKRFAKTE
jgi:glycogen(starch) synthase